MMMKKKWMFAAATLLAGGLLTWIWLGRGPAETAGIHRVDANGDVPPAAVARVERRNMGSTLAIAGEFKPFQDVDVHAKVAGYIRKIYVDVGDHVKEGQTLAVLEVPEIAAQLTGAEAAVRAAQEQIHKAQGDLQRARSAHAAAHSAYVRLKQAADSRAGLVAQQEVDDAQAKDLETEGQTASAEAELASAGQQLEVAQAGQKQYSAMSDYTRIVAPFAGIITNRYADTGALIAAGRLQVRKRFRWCGWRKPRNCGSCCRYRNPWSRRFIWATRSKCTCKRWIRRLRAACRALPIRWIVRRARWKRKLISTIARGG